MILLGVESVVAAPNAFSFTKFISISTGQNFQILGVHKPVKNTQLGQGQIQLRDPHRLEFSFVINHSLYKIQGKVQLRYLRTSSRGILLQLNYRGQHNGVPVTSNETVEADEFLASGGILTFKFNQQKHFMQLSINSAGQNRLVTEWGSVELR